MNVKCPRCGKPAQYNSENKFRPFCSERCATIDLGSWADEKYKVPAFEQEKESVNENDESESAPFADLPPKHHLN